MNPADYVVAKQWFGRSYPTVRFEYDANQLTTYIGIAQRGSATSASAWVIIKFTYDGNNLVTLIQTSKENVAWDDRAATTTIYA